MLLVINREFVLLLLLTNRDQPMKEYNKGDEQTSWENKAIRPPRSP